MTDVLATCREALKDSGHPLHRAVWLLFGQRLNVKTADRSPAWQLGLCSVLPPEE